MDDYEADVARQPKGAFSRPRERQLIRRVAEHWNERQRYNAERRRRIARYGWWFGLVAPAAVGAIKLVQSFWP